MLSSVRVVAPAPISRTPAASERLRLCFVVPRRGAPVPLTRFCEIVSSVRAALDPAVIRTPSCPKVGPVLVRRTAEQLPGSWPSGNGGPGLGELNGVHSTRPTMSSPRSVASLSTPDGRSGGRSFLAPSIRTPTAL